MLILRIILLLLMFNLVGCSLNKLNDFLDFNPRTGGMAELRPNDFAPVEADQGIGPEHALRFDLTLQQRHLDTLVLEGAAQCFPATVGQAKTREKRIIRALHSGLHFDAANDILVQRQALHRLEQQLDAVKQNATCVPPQIASNQHPEDIADRVAQLLNSDNQFVFDSSELNPKFVGRLAEAAMLLKDTHYALKIIGHADTVGQHEYNQSLSDARAQKVARYLRILGFPKQRLRVSAAGEDASEKRLVHRRVSIELVDSSVQNGTEESGQ